MLLSKLQSAGNRHHNSDTMKFVRRSETDASTEAEDLKDLYLGLTQLGQMRDHLKGMAMQGDGKYSLAFDISLETDGITRVNDRHYLIRRWVEGNDPGLFPEKKKYSAVWDLPSSRRKELVDEWKSKSKISNEKLSAFLEKAKRHDELLTQARSAKGQLDEQIIRSKRIIACTTSGAAKYGQVQSEAPGVIIVEEAGQVLESHIVTALNPLAKQLIMIGDHKQLRPFINYKLSVEKGDGYDLNRSMFERLILQGYTHQVLAQQHRMRPEISNLVRHLTYPTLIDAPKTQGRPDLLGHSSNVIFVDHEHREDRVDLDKRKVNERASKRNTFEAQMALKTVKYLLQQNYDSSSIVVLTPYLGQLKRLQEVFEEEVEAVLSNSDVTNLEKNGLIKHKSEVNPFERWKSLNNARTTAAHGDKSSSAKIHSTTSEQLGADTIDGLNHSKLPVVESEAIERGAPKAKQRRRKRPKIQISTIGK